MFLLIPFLNIPIHLTPLIISFIVLTYAYTRVKSFVKGYVIYIDSKGSLTKDYVNDLSVLSLFTLINMCLIFILHTLMNVSFWTRLLLATVTYPVLMTLSYIVVNNWFTFTYRRITQDIFICIICIYTCVTTALTYCYICEVLSKTIFEIIWCVSLTTSMLGLIPFSRFVEVANTLGSGFQTPIASLLHFFIRAGFGIRTNIVNDVTTLVSDFANRERVRNLEVVRAFVRDFEFGVTTDNTRRKIVIVYRERERGNIHPLIWLIGFKILQIMYKRTGTLYHVVFYTLTTYGTIYILNTLIVRDNEGRYDVLYCRPEDIDKPIEYLDLYTMGLVNNYQQYQVIKDKIKLIEQ